jgi:RNA polymerase sigma-70 factor, ECF subfamily
MHGHQDSAAERRWTRLFAPHLDAAFRLARWLTGSVAEAEDLVQESCLRAWRAAEPADPRAWLLAIVRNAAWTRLRQARRPLGSAMVLSFEDAVREVDRVASRQPGAEAALAERQRAEALRRALAALPPSFREAIVLRDLEELSYREIADILGLPVGTVMSRIARGRQRLRAALAAVPGEAADARDAG